MAHFLDHESNVGMQGKTKYSTTSKETSLRNPEGTGEDHSNQKSIDASHAKFLRWRTSSQS